MVSQTCLKVTVSIGLNGQPRRDEYQCIIPSKKSVVEQDEIPGHYHTKA